MTHKLIGKDESDEDNQRKSMAPEFWTLSALVLNTNGKKKKKNVFMRVLMRLTICFKPQVTTLD